MFLEINLDDTQEAKPAPIGTYTFQITGATEGVTGDNSKHPGAPVLKFSLQFTDLNLNAPGIYHYVSLPYPGDENAAFKLLMLKRFLGAFHIPYDNKGIDTEAVCFSAIGQTADLQVELTEPNENGDYFNRIRLPKLRDEPVGGRGGKPPKRRGD